jgi:alpha-L-rhamnosidase
MKRIVLLLNLFLLKAGLLVAQDLHLSDLRTENRANPTEVDATTPHFQWIIHAKKRNTNQSAFQILVSDDIQKIKMNIGNIWDNKLTYQSTSINIIYQGLELKSATKYFWKVRVKDNYGNLSNWSEIATFTTGIFNKNDWRNAQWISDDQLVDSLKNTFYVERDKDKARFQTILPLFRKSFLVNKKVKQAFAFVAGLGHFEFSVNGKKVGDHFLDAGWTKYDVEAQYVGFDITENIINGQNALGIELGNGFYFVPPIKERYRKLKTMFDYPKMICLVKIIYSDDSVDYVVSDNSWKTAKSPVTFSSIYGGEDYDARLEQLGWNKPSFNDTKWKSILVTDGPKKLSAQIQEPLKVFENFDAKQISVVSKSQTTFDLSQNFSGIIRLRVKGHAGDTIKIYPSELINKDSTANQKASGGPYFFQYILKGDAVEEWQPKFTYYGFRYLEVRNLPVDKNEPVKILALQGLHIRNAAPKTGSFVSSNKLYNQTYDLIDWAIKSNMVSVFTDCPHREKLGWLEELHLMGSSVNANYQIAPLLSKVMNDMRNAQTKSGLVPAIAPEYVQFNSGNDIFRDSPEWGSSAIIVPWYAYQWYGNEKVLLDNYSMMVNYLAYIQSQSKDLINYKGLSDWYDLGPKRPGVSQLTPIGLTATATWYYDLIIMTKIAKLLGKFNDIDKYQKLADEVKRAFNAKFFNQNTKQYATGSQTANAMAIFMGLVNDADRAAVLQNLILDIENRNNSLTAGDIGYRYVLRVLEAAERSDVINKMNNRSDVPGYGYQIANGATALTESWAALPSVSNNHFMLGHLMEWFYSGLCGINQTEDGIAYQNLIIKPQIVEGVNQAKAEFKSPYGYIKSSWKNDDEVFVLNLNIPVNCNATVFLPYGEASLDGEIVKSGIKIGSGIYQFKVIKK